MKSKQTNKYTIRGNREDLLKSENLYHYGTHKYNVYEKQKKEQRELIQNDRKYHYTYSQQYLTLSINPYDEYDEKKKEEKKQKAMNISTTEFRNVT